MTAGAILFFLIQNFNDLSSHGTNLHHRAKRHQNRSNIAEIWRFDVFLNGGRPHLGFVGRALGGSVAESLALARQLQELLDIDFIRKSTTAMASPIVCVLKSRNWRKWSSAMCNVQPKAKS